MLKLTRSAAALGAGLVSLAAMTAAVPALAQPRPMAAMPMAKADADMQRVLDKLAMMKGKPIETLTPAEARVQPSAADAANAVLTEMKGTPPPDGISAMNMDYPGAAGMQKARVYKPMNAKGPLPVIVYYHGGGWVIADLDTYDATPRALAKQVNAVVVSLDYRHAPENKFPAAWDDAFAGYKWALANAASWGGDTEKVALVGESAGGNLAINTAIKARDDTATKPKHIVAVYPVAQTDLNTPSYVEHGMAKPLNKAMIEWFVRHTTNGPQDLADPRIDLTKANLRDLPPVTIVNAEIDPLRDDGAILERSLKAQGVRVERRNYAGVTHEFFGMGMVVADAMAAQQYASGKLKAALK